MLSWATVEDPADALKALRRELRDPAKMRKARESIHAAMGDKLRGSVEDLWLDLPASPTFLRDIQQVRITEDLETHHAMTEGEFEWKNWIANYEQVKFRGHVFCLDDDAVRREAANAAREVLQDSFGVKLKGLAWSQAHNPA